MSTTYQGGGPGALKHVHYFIPHYSPSTCKENRLQVHVANKIGPNFSVLLLSSEKLLTEWYLFAPYFFWF